MEEKELKETCPYCRREVIYFWDNGVVSKPEYVLVADRIYHTDCWNKLVEENPVYL